MESIGLTVTIQCSDGHLMLSTNVACDALKELNKMSIILPWNVTVEDYIQEIVGLGLAGLQQNNGSTAGGVFEEALDLPLAEIVDDDTEVKCEKSEEDEDCHMEVVAESGDEVVIQKVKAKDAVVNEDDQNVVCVKTEDQEQPTFEDAGCGEEDLNKLLYEEVDAQGPVDQHNDDCPNADYGDEDITIVGVEALEGENDEAKTKVRNTRFKSTRGRKANRYVGTRKKRKNDIAIPIAFGKVFVKKGDELEDLQCHLCGLKYDTKRSLCKHIFMHGRLPHQCNICHKRYRDQDLFEKHLLIHSSDRKFKCIHCQNSYNSKKILTKHMYTHFKIKRKVNSKPAESSADGHQCSICGSAFDDVNQYNTHMVRHEMTTVETRLNSETMASTKIRYCTFDDCRRYFLTLAELEDHISTSHDGCSICGKHFTSKPRLIRHMDEIHRKAAIALKALAGSGSQEEDDAADALLDIKPFIAHVNNYPCSLCDKVYKTQSEVNKHYQRVHHKPFKCPGHCNQMFGTRTQVRFHVMDYTGTKPFKCALCKRTFTTKAAYEVHMTIHSGLKPFVCEICGAKFVEKQRLQRHMICHSTERNFKCPSCDKWFKTKASVNLHHKSHLDTRPFTCMRCHKGFTRHSHLYRHIKENCHTSKNVTKVEVVYS